MSRLSKMGRHKSYLAMFKTEGGRGGGQGHFLTMFKRKMLFLEAFPQSGNHLSSTFQASIASLFASFSRAILASSWRLIALHDECVWKCAMLFFDTKFLFYDRSGYWLVGDDYEKDSGSVKSEQRGLTHIPETGWQVSDNGGWKRDTGLTVVAV